MTTNTYQFVTLESFKNRIGIEDDGLDDQILYVIRQANRSLSLELAPILGRVDLTSMDLFEDAVVVAHIYTRVLYELEVLHQNEPYELHKKEYKDQLKTLKAAIIAGLQDGRPARSKLAIFSSDPSADSLILPNQKYDSILD